MFQSVDARPREEIATNSNRENIPLWLALDLAEERVGIMMDSGALSADAIAYAYRDISHELWPKPGWRNLTQA